jgi:TolB-like protein/DNA-binding winged helix-turn-helix (wHTH) protein/Flp pilus assembly protein TadD
MDALNSADLLLLGTFRFDRRSRTLSRLDTGSQIPLGSRAIDVLGVLLERAGDLVPKDDIIQAVWPEMVVEEANLTVHISTLRRVLDAGRVEGSCIQTISGRGYRFIGGVIRPESGLPRELEAAASSATASIEAATRPVSPRQPRGFTRSALILVVALCLVGVTSAAVLTSGYRWFAETAAQTPRLSIVVLPFANLSDDPGQDYFVDAITDDLTTDLSRLDGSFVISRNTAITYRGKPIAPKQIGRELGVRYVVEGSIRRSGSQIRANIQLIDSQTASHVWAERFDRDIGDLFALESEIASRIAIALNFAMIRVEATRPTANPDALDYLFRARAIALKPPTRESATEVIALFEQALALDPAADEVKVRLALSHIGRVLLQMSNPQVDDLARADDLLAQISTGSARAHWAKAQLLRARHQYADAIPEYETAIALDRNFAGAYANLGHTKLLNGSLEEVVPLVEKAIRLSPRDPDLGYWYDLIGLMHLLHSRTSEAIIWLERARTASPARPFIHADLAAAYGIKGESERAVAELAEARRLNDDPNRYSSLAGRGRFGSDMTPNLRALYEATYILGLRKAGMPDE